TTIISGGGRGLGAQIAVAYAEADVNIAVCSRKEEAGEEMSDKLKGKGVVLLAYKVDVTNPVDIKHVVKQTKEHFGSIDILVNNSGATWGASVEEMPHDAWEKVMNVNINGTFYMSQEVGKVMIEQNSGKIINISSIAGF